MQSAARILITGPARSGKSEWAESLAKASCRPVIYVATASVAGDDPEWQARIAKHQQRRPSTWKTYESPLSLANVLKTASPETCLLIDSLGTWLANHLEQSATMWELEVTSFLSQLSLTQAQVIVVAEETGWGVVPAYPLGRLFRDRLGTLTRQVAVLATEFYLVVGGYALDLKKVATPVPHSV